MFEYLGVALGLLGAALVSSNNNKLRLTGYWVWICSNVFLVGSSINAEQYATAFMFTLYGIFAVNGIRNCSKPKEVE